MVKIRMLHVMLLLCGDTSLSPDPIPIYKTLDLIVALALVSAPRSNFI